MRRMWLGRETENNAARTRTSFGWLPSPARVGFCVCLCNYLNTYLIRLLSELNRN